MIAGAPLHATKQYPTTMPRRRYIKSSGFIIPLYYSTPGQLNLLRVRICFFTFLGFRVYGWYWKEAPVTKPKLRIRISLIYKNSSMVYSFVSLSSVAWPT